MTGLLSDTARLVPTTDRALRGLLDAIGEIDVAGRPDIAHVLDKMRMVLSHLATRNQPETLAELRQLGRDVGARIGALGDAVPDSEGEEQLDYDGLVDRLTDGLRSLSRPGREADPAGLATDEALEARFYAALMPTAARPETQGFPPLTAERFEAYLLAKFPGTYDRVVGFTRLVGGFQKETFLVDAALASGGETVSMVIRAEKHDRFVRMTASAISDEYGVVRPLWERGIPVAEPLWLEADASLLGRRFMVSARAKGRNTGSAYGDSAQFAPALTRSFVETLARIHNQPIDADLAATALGPWRAHATLPANTRAEIAAWRDQIWLRPPPASPSFARLFDWLEANVPEDDEPAKLLHNDYGPHNILVEGEAVSAVLDWEITRIGDPAEDLSFFLQCAGAAIDRNAALAQYQEISGNRITRFRMAYFDVLSIGKVLVSTLSAAAMYQHTEPALVDWMQMPLRGHGAYQSMVEMKIAAAKAVRGQ